MSEVDESDLKPCPLCSHAGAIDPACSLCNGTGVTDTQAIYAHMEQLWVGIHKFAKDALAEAKSVNSPSDAEDAK